MPHPRILGGYEEIIPGTAREILEMAKSEQKHRHKIDIWKRCIRIWRLPLVFYSYLLCQ
jgi:uncharacterized membrane protein